MRNILLLNKAQYSGNSGRVVEYLRILICCLIDLVLCISVSFPVPAVSAGPDCWQQGSRFPSEWWLWSPAGHHRLCEYLHPRVCTRARRCYPVQIKVSFPCENQTCWKKKKFTESFSPREPTLVCTKCGEVYQQVPRFPYSWHFLQGWGAAYESFSGWANLSPSLPPKDGQSPVFSFWWQNPNESLNVELGRGAFTEGLRFLCLQWLHTVWTMQFQQNPSLSTGSIFHSWTWNTIPGLLVFLALSKCGSTASALLDNQVLHVI